MRDVLENMWEATVMAYLVGSEENDEKPHDTWFPD
jgi:hypothetical protein